MNRLIIYQYINRLIKEDIVRYCNSQGIFVDNNDLDVVYYYVKNEYKRFFNDQMGVLNEIKGKVSDYTYGEIMKAYDKYKYVIK